MTILTIAAQAPLIDWTISVGNLLTIITFLVGGTWFAAVVKGRVDAQGKQILSVQEEQKEVGRKIDKIYELNVAAAVLNERMNAIDHRVNAQGARLDQTLARINTILDGEYLSSGKIKD